MAEVAFVPVQTVEEAIQRLEGESPGQAALMAGGTDLLVRQRQKLVSWRTLLYLKSVRSLSKIEFQGDGGWVLGAVATLDEVAHHPEIQRRFPMVAQAAAGVASPQVRHKATLGGNICLESRCWFYNRSSYWRAEYPQCRKASGGDRCYVLPKSRKGCFALQSGDTVGPLVALGAKLKLVSNEGERVIPIEDLYRGDGKDYLALDPHEILTHVLLQPSSTTGVFVKFRPQNNLDFATFTLSVIPPWAEGRSRIVVGSVASKPLRVRKAERLWDQGEGDARRIAMEAAKELRIVSFIRGSVEYKRKVIEAKLGEIITGLMKSSRFD